VNVSIASTTNSSTSSAAYLRLLSPAGSLPGIRRPPSAGTTRRRYAQSRSGNKEIPDRDLLIVEFDRLDVSSPGIRFGDGNQLRGNLLLAQGQNADPR
jgi:hypothetical protein